MTDHDRPRSPRVPPGDDNAALYAATGLFVLRAPVLPADTLHDLNARPGAAGMGLGRDDPHSSLARKRREGRGMLRRLADLPRVRQALHSVSPSVAAAVSALDKGEGSEKAVDRTYGTLLRYLTRMSTRPTPYGLFAGVAVGGFAARTRVELDRDPVRRTRTRADAAWLARIIKRLEDDKRIRDDLPVRVNTLLHRVGDHLFLSEPAGDDIKARRIELAVSRPVEAVLGLAEPGATFGDLVTGLLERFPEVEEQRVRRVVDHLWELGILRSDVQPPLTVAVPEGHVIKRLIDYSVRTDVVDGLRTMRLLADAVDSSPGLAGIATLDRLSAHQRVMAPGFTGSTYQQDTGLATVAAEMSDNIAAAAAEAAELTMRLGCVRPRAPHLVDYHREFLERYGMDAQLPLLDVLDPVQGLGPPNSYREPPRPQPLHEQRIIPTARRDAALVDLVANAAHHGLHEVELDDDWVDRLTAWRPDDPRCRPRTSLDLFFQLAAESPQAIDEGRWRLVLSTVGYYGGLQGVSRFFHLFDEATTHDLRKHVQAEEASRPDTIFADLNYAPGARGANLARHPSLRDYEICVNVAPTLPADRQIPLGDILLSADAGSFHLSSARLGRRLTVSQSYALNPGAAPNVCRALLDFSADGFTRQALFDLGPVGDAPFLPRLSRGKVVVHPAQWTIRRETFSPSITDRDEFYRACQRWRETWNIPRHTYLCELDNRLLLDLDHPLWVDELHREVKRLRRDPHANPIHLQEVYPAGPDMWLRDGDGRRYHSEIIVPLVLGSREPMPGQAIGNAAPTLKGPAAPSSNGRTGPGPIVTRRWLPGTEWTHLKLYAAPELHDRIITGPLRSLLSEAAAAGDLDRWFYIRYADPLPHLRLRFHAAEPSRGDAILARCAAWARRQVEAGRASDFTFASYTREVERYGGAHAIDMVESVFWANSEVSVELVRLLHAESGGYDAEVLCVAALHALYQSWGMDPPARRSETRTRDIADATRRRFRAIRPLLCEVLSPGERRPDPQAARYLSALSPILGHQHHIASSAGRQARRLAEQGMLTGSEENVVDSLAHIQSIRLLGLDRDRERRCQDLWVLALRAIRGRP